MSEVGKALVQTDKDLVPESGVTLQAPLLPPDCFPSAEMRSVILLIKEAHTHCGEADPKLLKVKTHEVRAVATSVAFKQNRSLRSMMNTTFLRSNLYSHHYLKRVQTLYEDCYTLGPFVAANAVGIFRVPEQDVLIKRIPDMQKAVSNTLRNIQVTHRKYQPFFLAENYSQQLQRLVTALGDYHGSRGFPKSWPESLSSLQLVVESAAGPLMLSPTGQILTPSSCPPWLLVNFITENMDHAKQRIHSYESIRDREKALHAKCMEDIGLDFLEKNDAIAPDMMIDCLERLLTSSHRLNVLLSGARLWITTYYTVMIDGEVCIPWNWD
ncbi:T-cell activation inhibitor, mitochondrial-like [Palaemon carinicauda]|uniref:T-cell activation inhibitor, mitochondrial-like n=1 Tax=Palaemon carinicauda TaxID=392227 RepID=UPI0035B64864